MADKASILAADQILFGEMNPAPLAVQAYQLAPLPYAYDALEPHISSEIMSLHFDRHHRAYVTNLNAALANYSTAATSGNVVDLLALQSAIRFNGGGHINHAMFWPSLAPAASEDAKDPQGKAPQLMEAVSSAFGDFGSFKTAFSAALLSLQGSGWGWLVRSTQGIGGALRIVTTKDQDSVLDDVPIFGIDMWEHAYYLQYKNGKQSYVDNIWQIINWTTAEQRYLGIQDAKTNLVKVALSTGP